MSATSAAGAACDGSWMSVRIGTPCRALIAASTRRPSARPGPRNERPDVRFALSNEALKISGTPTRRAISSSAAAMAIACASLSMTHGPAISTSGLPKPMGMSPTLMGFTGLIVRGQVGQVGRSGRSASRGRVCRRLVSVPTA